MNYRQCRESIGQFEHAGDVNVQIKVLNDFVDAIEFRNDDFENGCDKGHDPASLLPNRERGQSQNPKQQNVNLLSSLWSMAVDAYDIILQNMVQFTVICPTK